MAKMRQVKGQNRLPQAPEISAERVLYSIRTRFNPIPNLTPALLGTYLESFRLGFLRNAAITWDSIEKRDYTLGAVANKRKKDAARHGWEIVTVDDSPEAMAQKEKLEYFYNHITATNALNGSESGGMSLLLRQMMDAVGKYWAVHEIMWNPSMSGDLSAEFKFCPLWWFENTTGTLRFLPSEFSVYGGDMAEAEWLVTAGDGLMEACSIAYIYKGLSLKDWVAFNEKLAMPGILGKTSAIKSSPEWDSLVEAVQNFSSEFAAVVNDGASIEMIESKSSGQTQYDPLVDKMDRAMVTLWRGGDLGTSSREHSSGSNRQQGETEILQQDDAQWLGETLTNNVSRFVLKYHFGEDAPQLAYIRIKSAAQSNIDEEIKIDTFLLSAGAPMSVQAALERYGRPTPDADDILLKPAAAPQPQPSNNPQDPEETEDPSIANDKAGMPMVQIDALAKASRHEFVQSLVTDLKPVYDQLNAILAINDDVVFENRLQAFLKALPGKLKDINQDPATAQALYNIISTALTNGLALKKGSK